MSLETSSDFKKAKQLIVKYIVYSLYNIHIIFLPLQQSMTLGFGTYKPFGPVLMRTLLARKYIDQIWHKLKESNEKHHDITCLFSWIKKDMSLCLFVRSFVLLILIILPPPQSSSLNLLSYTGTCKIITSKPWSYLRETGQIVPTFFQNKIYFTKTRPILFAKMACLIKKNLFKRWYQVCNVL